MWKIGAQRAMYILASHNTTSQIYWPWTNQSPRQPGLRHLFCSEWESEPRPDSREQRIRSRCVGEAGQLSTSPAATSRNLSSFTRWSPCTASRKSQRINLDVQNWSTWGHATTLAGLTIFPATAGRRNRSMQNLFKGERQGLSQTKTPHPKP